MSEITNEELAAAREIDELHSDSFGNVGINVVATIIHKHNKGSRKYKSALEAIRSKANECVGFEEIGRFAISEIERLRS